MINLKTDYYWFDPEENNLYGPDSISHVNLIKNNKEIDKIIDQYLDSENSDNGNTHDILTNIFWVRAYYNPNIHEIGISCKRKNDAHLAIKEIFPNVPLVNSLFLDIDDTKFQGKLESHDLHKFLKFGRLL